MKKLNLIFILLAILTLNNGCKKDKDEDENLPASFSVKVEGTLWTGNTYTAAHSTILNSTEIVAYGISNSEYIVLDINGSGTGTYAIDDHNTGSGLIGGTVFSTTFHNNPSGDIIITKYDESNGKISGTFSFVGYGDSNVFTVTEGKFVNVGLITQ